jgi:putative membrane protein
MTTRLPTFGQTSAAPRRDGLSLGIVIILGAALSWICSVYPARMPLWAPWEFSWVEYLGCVLALVWYGAGVLRMPPGTRPPLWRQISFGTGILLMYAVTQTWLTYLAQHLFLATQAQQFVLHDLAPFLVALAWPWATLRQGAPDWVAQLGRGRIARSVFRVLQQPVVAAGLFVALLVAQVLPALMFRVMLNGRLFDLMNIVMAVDGVLFWSLVLDPRPREQAGLSYFARMVLAFLAMLPVMPIGAYITFTSHSLYGFYDLCGRLLPWIEPMVDQRMGGLMYWIPGGLMGAFAVLFPLNAMRLAEEKAERAQGKRVMVQVGQRQIDPSAWTGR